MPSWLTDIHNLANSSRVLVGMNNVTFAREREQWRKQQRGTAWVQRSHNGASRAKQLPSTSLSL